MVVSAMLLGYVGASQNYGYHFGDPYNKDYSIMGYIGAPYFVRITPSRWRPILEPFRAKAFDFKPSC